MIYRADFKDVCRSFNHLEIVRFLIGLQWKKIANKNPNVAIFQKNNELGFYQVVVPLNLDFSDYGDMMYKVAEELSLEQNKSVEEVVLELSNPLSDIVKVRIDDDSVNAGSVLFEDAIKLFANSKKLIQYAAQDAIQPRKYYGNGRICDDVHRFMEQCRFGQTEVGSYITNIVCPFVYKDENDKFQQMSLFDDEKDVAVSLTRKATKKLMNSLAEVKSCIDEGDDLEKLADREQNRISINFLESLENLNINKNGGNLDVKIKWSSTVLENKSECNKVVFSHNYYTPINSVTQKVKRDQQNEVQEDYVGLIKAVKGHEDIEERNSGIINLVVVANDKKRTVKARLSKADYNDAVEAHKKGKYVRVKGKYEDKILVCKEFGVFD